MDLTLRLIISIIAVIGGGFSIGFILYGLLVKDDGDIIKRYLIVFALCAVVFLGVNYEWYLVKAIRIPPGYSEYLAPSLKNSYSGADEFGIEKVSKKPDGSVEIKMMIWKYYVVKKQEEQFIDSFIDGYAHSLRNSITGIEFPKPYNDLKITAYRRNLNSIEVNLIANLLPGFGKFYRSVFYKEENAKIIVSIICEETGEIVGTGEV